MKFNPNIISVKIIGLKKQQVICETETDQIILIKKPKNDFMFTEVMRDLLRTGLWIPVNKKLKQFMKYDWLDNSELFGV
ncbi:hypothetical protein [Liquorilactobacillus vini]|uniref:Uncharacterized protein n=1 Tax=Liquorilactobacillus vini DSM 20605 TaxID=1133569 RepID=A0A0R2C4N6_9LACO|nr:hypothetical protein [Liquorilactobacillus vini]KRM86863.1 hypothetical protein FD21_GL001452 [Liquorilactobacillus vini DSM 20605]